MGSSKKHKEKHGDKEHKRKKRHRSRSRSPHDSKDVNKSKSKEKKHRRGEDGHGGEKKRSKRDRYESPPPIDVITERIKHEPVKHEEREKLTSGEGAENLSLSIEDTNKLREKLGLKPLDVGGSRGGEDGDGAKLDEDVHAPPENLGAIKKADELRQKMAAIKEKRLINQKLGKVKKLADSDSDSEDVLGWIKKSRKVAQEKKLADQRAKMLQEMDEEFGIGDLVEEAFAVKKKQDYSSRDLKGLTVKHDEADFEEGSSIILTLEDKNVLAEDGDALMNVYMIDMERTRKNMERKKKKPEYNPYDNSSIDDDGILQHKDILSKYDEEIAGEKQKSFELGARGRYNAEHEKAMRMYKQDLAKQGESLILPSLTVASEYYTDREMEKFKKVKKKTRKIRKKTKLLTADDLLPMYDEQQAASNFGSRSRGRGAIKIEDDIVKTEEEPIGIPGLDLVDDMEVDEPELLAPAIDILGPDEDLTGVVVDDDAGYELQFALAKTRRLKQKHRRRNPVNVVEQHVRRTGVKEESDDDDDDDQQDEEKGMRFESEIEGKRNIQLNRTSEFCRALGEMPTYGQSGNRPEEEEDELLDFERDLMEQRRKQAEEEGAGASGWQKVEIDTEPVDIKEVEHPALEEEPLVESGLATALSLAKKKGYLVEEKVKKAAHMRLDIETELDANYSIEDKRYDDLDDKYRRGRGGDRFSGGISQDFKELDTYKPNVKLEYNDENGRALNRKEAFRQLSHRFHGKGSGKKKIEKRAKKIEQDQLMLMASSSDTPLGTVEMMKQKQRVEQTPYVLLSGTKTASISKT